jgi:peptidyl-prolyl cis-trans isomerase SurA
MKKAFPYSILLLPLSLLGLGCNAAMNPPKVPGKTVAPSVKLLWIDEKAVDQHEPAPTERSQGLDLGLNKGIVATVDQKAITLKEFDAAFFRALQEKPWDMSEKDLYHRVLEDLVVSKLLLIYGEGLEEIEITDYEVDLEMERVSAKHPEGWEGYRRMLNMESLSLLDIREQVKEGMLLDRVQSVIFRGMGSPSPQEIRSEYKKRRREFMTDEERDVSLLIVFNETYADKEEQLEKLLGRISDRLQKHSFAEVAKQFSEGPKAEEGGRQGWIKKKGLAPELSEVAFGLSKGELSGPHKSKDFSFYLYCHDAKYASSREMNEVQSYLENAIRNSKRQELMNAKLKELYSLHHIQKLSPDDYMRYRTSLRP